MKYYNKYCISITLLILQICKYVNMQIYKQMKQKSQKTKPERERVATNNQNSTVKPTQDKKNNNNTSVTNSSSKTNSNENIQEEQINNDKNSAQNSQNDKAYQNLNYKYTLWVQELQRLKIQSYGSGLKEVTTIATMGQFWQIFQFLKKTNDFPTNCDLYLFKQGIKPEWQDKANVGGGCFKIKIDKKKSNKLWQNTIFCIISPQNKLSHLINGVRMKIKQKFDQIQIWMTAQASSRQKTDLLKIYFKENLQITDERIFSFFAFK